MSMDIKELTIIILGSIAFIWLLTSLNSFVGGESIFKYVGMPVALGVVVMILGMGFYYFTIPYYAK